MTAHILSPYEYEYEMSEDAEASLYQRDFIQVFGVLSGVPSETLSANTTWTLASSVVNWITLSLALLYGNNVRT
jgi:hypothetical protein